MSEKEKSTTDSALTALNKLAQTKGPDYVSGLVDGINLGTAAPDPRDDERNP